MHLTKSNSGHLEYFLPLLPLLSEYTFGGIQLVLLVMLVLSFIQLRKQGFRFIFGKNVRPFLIMFFFVCCKDLVIVLLGPSNSQESLNKWIVLCVYFICFFALSQSSFDLDKYYKVLKIVCLFYSLGLLFQLFQIYVLRQSVIGISLIPGYTFTNTNEPFRPRSFFSEPSAYATAMIPLVFISLKKQDFKVSVLATIAILLSSSTAGVVLASVFWIYTFLLSDVKTWKKMVVLVVGLGIMAFIGVSTIAQESLSKITDTLQGGGSYFARISIGFNLLPSLNVWQWIFGTLYNVPYDFVIHHPNLVNELILHIYSDVFFVNTFCGVIFRYGIIGFLLFFYPLIKWARRKEFYGSVFAIALIVETIGGTVLFNAHYFCSVMLLLMLDLNQNNNIETFFANRGI